MANVSFLRGSQSDLNAIKASLATTGTVTEGAFYLTNDTNRLYFAQSSKNLVDLNQYIHIYEGSGLPPVTDTVQPGDFYFLSQSNILAIYDTDPTTNQLAWRRINPDTTLKTSSSVLSVTAGGVGTNTAVIGASVQDSRNNTASGSFNITGGDNVHVSVSGNTLTITSDNDTTNTTYTLSTISDTSGAKIRLTDNATTPNNQDILIKGAGGISVTKDGNDIKITGANPVNSVSTGFESNGKLITSIGFSSGSPISNTSTAKVPTISYGNGTTKSTAVFDGSQTNPTASLDVYTITEINDLFDSKLSSFDAMTYKGTLADEAAALAVFSATGNSAAKAGDTYKISSSFTFGNTNAVPSTLQNVKVTAGDLIIAGGTDSAIVWERVPSGDDQTISGELNASSKIVKIKDQANTLGGIQFIEDSTSGASVIGITTTNTNNILQTTIKHGNAGTALTNDIVIPADNNATAQSFNTDLYIPVITGLTRDKHGHVVAATTGKYKLKDTHANVSSFVNNISITGNTATIGTSLSLDNGRSTGTSNFIIKSNGLNVSQENNATTPTVIIDLQWGSFSST